jgi:hypothetical protein
VADAASKLAPPVVHNALLSPAQQLDPRTRGFFEARFGRDLSQVRVHAGAEAHLACESIGADAYAVGRDVVFGLGRYSPNTPDGRRLLAHELAHTIEAPAGARPAALRVSSPGDHAEHRAQQAAEAVIEGRLPRLRPGSAPHVVHRRQKLTIGPDVKALVLAHGRGELNDLIDKIIIDGKFHQIQTMTVAGVEHVWEVMSIAEERSLYSTYKGRTDEVVDIAEAGGKRIRHRKLFTLVLERGKIEAETVLHELIHLRISIDKDLAQAPQSSFSREHDELQQMATDPALGMVTGMSAKHKGLADAVDALRAQFEQLDPSAVAKLRAGVAGTDSVIGFLVQEKYANQTAGAAFANKHANATIARGYASAVQSLFEQQIATDRLAHARSLGLLDDRPILIAEQALEKSHPHRLRRDRP